jgi:predicted nucleic acid-binding protein
MTDGLRFAVDTNILVYAQGFDDARRRDIANELLSALGLARTVLPTQVLGELYRFLIGKAGMPRANAAARIGQIMGTYPLAEAGKPQFSDALNLAAAHQLQFWDALILATAADAGCRLLLSEDMADGFVWKGCTVANPFARTLHPLLLDALRP